MSRLKTLGVSVVLISAGLLWFQNCSPLKANRTYGSNGNSSGWASENVGGTTTDNPKVAVMSVNVDGYNSKVTTSFCATSVGFVDSAERDLGLEEPAHITGLSGEYDANLGRLEVPTGTYDEVVVHLSPTGCGVLNMTALAIENAHGNYYQASTLALRFKGPFEVTHQSTNLSLDMTNLLTALETVKGSEQIVDVVAAERGEAKP